MHGDSMHARAEELVQTAKDADAIHLHLKGIGLQALPESMRALVKLQELDISQNALTTLPNWISEFARLRTLRMWGNQLTTLPDCFTTLAELRLLDASNNEIRELPTTLGRLSHLESLMIWRNQLTALPSSLSQLTRLQRLDASANQLAQIPEWFGALLELQVLALWGNRLRSLPNSLPQLRRLHTLDVSNNPLGFLPDNLGELADLQFLIVWGNQLTALPDSLCRLAKLRLLDASKNRLTQLPECLGQLSQLESLIVWGNQLKSLPNSLRGLRSLTKLLLHENEALGLPRELLGPFFFEIDNQGAIPANPARLLDYYFHLRSGTMPLNEAKLILVGRGGVGKTSLANRLVHGTFDKYQSRTDGIGITHWKLRLMNDEDIRLNIWDFGGQEIMHATHQLFLTERTLYLLVVDGRSGTEDEDVEYWLKFIESYGPDSPVIVVLNKIRELSFEVNERGLRLKHPAIRGFVRTDCEDSTGLQELRCAIETQADRLDHLRDPFPAAWSAIKERLSGMRENYLTFGRYREICAEKGEQDVLQQESLAYYLHCLGIALNYKDDPRLREKYILNPRWITSGIYRILTCDRLKEQKGLLSIADVLDILPPDDYPADTHVFLLDLMMRFELCFDFTSDNCRYLVPELLDKQEPNVVDEFPLQECLNFEYHYSVLPEGLLPRFIVRTHVLSESLPRWRTGVILQFERNRALVKAEIADKKVTISINGPVAGRRRLLAIIRSDFERIHNDIRKLRPQAMVPVPGRPDVVVPLDTLNTLEENGIRHYQLVSRGEMIQIDVTEMLNGADVRRDACSRARDETPYCPRLFLSYSHKDAGLRDAFLAHLKILERKRIIACWSDREIQPSDFWAERIDKNLNQADIIVLFISADFISSDACQRELCLALERAQTGTRVIPVIVRDVNWVNNAPFSHLQVLPDGLPVTQWEDRDAAWRSVCEGIERVAKELGKNRPHPG